MLWFKCLQSVREMKNLKLELWRSECALLPTCVLQMGGSSYLNHCRLLLWVSVLIPRAAEKHSCQNITHCLVRITISVDPLNRFPLHEDLCSATFWSPKIIIMLPSNHLSLLLTNPPLATTCSAGYRNPQQPQQHPPAMLLFPGPRFWHIALCITGIFHNFSF